MKLLYDQAHGSSSMQVSLLWVLDAGSSRDCLAGQSQAWERLISLCIYVLQGH